MKRLLSMILALAMVLAFLPQMAIDVWAEDVSFTGVCGDNLNWEFNDQNGTLTITGSGDMFDYEWTGNEDWQPFRSQIKAVLLPDGLTSVGQCAFIRFPITGNVAIPTGVTRIGDGAFNDCDMSAVTIPDSVKTIGYGAFCSCDNLTEIKIPAGITEIGEEVFASCTGLNAVTIPGNIQAIGNRAFQSCTGLKSVTFPDSVTIIGDNAFCGTGLERVTIGANVTNVGFKAFADCSALTAIEVDSANTKYASDGGVLCNKQKTQVLQCPCGRAEPYEIPVTATAIGQAAFENCSNLTGLTITGNILDIPDYAFRNCAGLTEIVLPGSLKTIGWTAFYGCTGLTEIRIPEGVTEIFADAFAGCTALKAVKIMSKNCVFSVSGITLGVPGSTIIFGHKGSTAETFANTYGYTFKELSQEDDPCALGHDFSEWSQTKEPTCTEAGARTRTCARCNLVETDPIEALGHDWDTGSVTVEPTATTPGVRTFNCKRCNETKTERIRPTGSTAPDDIDFTDPADKDKFEIIGQESAAIVEGEGVSLVSSQGGVEPAKQSIAETPRDVVEVEVEDDWIATLKFDFTQNGASNGWYQFFGFYAAADYQNMAGIRGGDGAMQDFLRVGGAITEETKSNEPGLASDGTFWYRIEKQGDTYICSRSGDGETFTEMFTHESTGIEATKIVIDAYTGMTEGYKFTLKSLTFEGGAGPVEPPMVDKTALEKAIRDYQFITTTNYTPESVDAFQSAIKAGKAILDDPDVTQDAVDAAAQAILDAYAALEFEADDPFRFDDVKDESKFFFNPVYWAFENEPQITNGVDATHFGPDNACTRGHVVTFLWRAAGCPEPKNAETPFKDLKEGAFYEKAVAWAVENEITNGLSADKFGPDATCTRGQIVTFLWRFKGQPDPETATTPFTDLKSGAFYEKAVAWAVENEVTNGMSADKFGPDATCTRGQVVTFLYRTTQK